MLIILLCSLWDNQHHGAARKQHHFNSILNKQNQLQQIYDDRFSLSLSLSLSSIVISQILLPSKRQPNGQNQHFLY